MKNILILLVLVSQDHSKAAPTLADTLEWMSHFAVTHGYSTEDGTIAEENRIISLDGCSVAVTHKFPHAGKTAHDLKEAEDFISLEDMNPDVRIHHEGSNFEVKFESSDSARKITHSITLGDGEKVESHTSDDHMYFDSEESAKRFGTALTHAITLCGGKPAPF